jgi:hypothetical protein
VAALNHERRSNLIVIKPILEDNYLNYVFVHLTLRCKRDINNTRFSDQIISRVVFVAFEGLWGSGHVPPYIYVFFVQGGYFPLARVRGRPT